MNVPRFLNLPLSMFMLLCLCLIRADSTMLRFLQLLEGKMMRALPRSSSWRSLLLCDTSALLLFGPHGVQVASVFSNPLAEDMSRLSKIYRVTVLTLYSITLNCGEEFTVVEQFLLNNEEPNVFVAFKRSMRCPPPTVHHFASSPLAGHSVR